MILALFLLAAPASAPAGLTLEIDIVKLRSDKGGVMVALYNDASAYPGKADKAVRKAYVTIKELQAHVAFKDLAPGEYAVSIIHDENGNQKVDSNFLGIPKEGLGASNDAKGFMGPPKYKDAKFDLRSDGQKIAVIVHYL